MSYVHKTLSILFRLFIEFIISIGEHGDKNIESGIKEFFLTPLKSVFIKSFSNFFFRNVFAYITKMINKLKIGRF